MQGSTGLCKEITKTTNHTHAKRECQRCCIVNPPHTHTRKFPYERFGSCLLTYQLSISWNVVNGFNEVGFRSFHVHRLYVHHLVSKSWGLCKVSEGTVVHVEEHRMLVLVELSFWVDEVAEVIESSSNCWVGTDP